MANPASEQQEEDIEVTNHTEKIRAFDPQFAWVIKWQSACQFLLLTPAGEEGCMHSLGSASKLQPRRLLICYILSTWHISQVHLGKWHTQVQVGNAGYQSSTHRRLLDTHFPMIKVLKAYPRVITNT